MVSYSRTRISVEKNDELKVSETDTWIWERYFGEGEYEVLKTIGWIIVNMVVTVNPYLFKSLIKGLIDVWTERPKYYIHTQHTM